MFIVNDYCVTFSRMPTAQRSNTALKAKAAKAIERQEWAWANAAEVYRERDLLVRALSLLYPAHLMRHVGHHSGNRKPVVCIHSPAGQLAWTIPDDMAGQYSHLEETANDWDGCKTSERMTRLLNLIR